MADLPVLHEHHYDVLNRVARGTLGMTTYRHLELGHELAAHGFVEVKHLLGGQRIELTAKGFEHVRRGR